jgi:hypothetical protein
MNKIIKVNIRKIQAGDTIIFQGKEKTVCAKDIRECPFMGRSIFGDSCLLGRNPRCLNLNLTNKPMKKIILETLLCIAVALLFAVFLYLGV